MGKKDNDKKAAVLIKPPETLFQFIKTLVVGVIKSLPKTVIWALLRSVVSFGIVMVVNAYVIAYINEGVSGTVPRESPWFYLLNLYDNKPAFNALCFVFFYVVTALYSRIRSRGFKAFFIDLFQSFAWTVKSLDSAGKAAVPLLLIFMGLAFYARIFTENKYLFLTMAIGLFLMYTLQEKNTLMVVSKLTWSDLQRWFSRSKQRKPLNTGIVSVATFGVFLGILVLNFIPFDKQLIPYIGGGLLVVLGFFLVFRKINPKTAMFILGAAVIGYLMYRLKLTVLADDGGYQELGGTMDSFLSSGQGQDVIATGQKPGFFGAVGSFLGGLFSSGAQIVSDVADASVQTVSNAYDYTKQTVSDAYDYTKQTVSDTYDAAKEVVTDAYDKAKEVVTDAYNTVTETVVDTYEAAKEVVSDAYDTAKEVVTDTYEAAKEVVTDTYEAAKEVVSDTYEAAKEVVSDAYDSASEFVSETYDWVADEAKWAADFTGDFLTGVGNDFVGAYNDISNFAGKAYDAVSDLAGGVSDFVKDAWDNPQILIDGVKNTWDSVTGGLSDAYDYTKGLVSDIIDNPRILWETAVNSFDTVKNVASNLWNAAYTTVTDPAKAWEFVKDTVGWNNFANSVDPNRSLLERLGNTGIGLFKLGSTLFTAGQAGTAIKAGGTKALGFVDDLAAAYTKNGPKGVLDDLAGLFGKKTVKPPAAVAKYPTVEIKTGPNYTTAAKNADLSAIPESSKKSIQYVADEMGVQIHVRPSNPASKAWIESGQAVPKPCAIKAKTLNPLDEMIGGPKNQEGLVSVFNPTEPSEAALKKMSPELREKVMKRFAQRQEEFGKLKPEIDKLKGQYEIDPNGIVRDVTKNKPVAGDIDLFDITSFDGKPLPKNIQQQVVDRLKSISTKEKSLSNVEHGPVTMWDETDHAFDAVAKGKMVDAAGAGGEGVITFNPLNTATHSYHK